MWKKTKKASLQTTSTYFLSETGNLFIEQASLVWSYVTRGLHTNRSTFWWAAFAIPAMFFSQGLTNLMGHMSLKGVFKMTLSFGWSGHALPHHSDPMSQRSQVSGVILKFWVFSQLSLALSCLSNCLWLSLCQCLHYLLVGQLLFTLIKCLKQTSLGGIGDPPHIILALT